jgi:predicted Zn-dependent protease
VYVFHKIPDTENDSIWLKHFPLFVSVCALYSDTTRVVREYGRFYRLLHDKPAMVASLYPAHQILLNLKMYYEILCSAGQLKEAGMVSNTIVAREPNVAINYVCRAQIPMALKQYGKVIELSDKALAQNRHLAQMYLLKAAALEHQGKMNWATAVLTQGMACVSNARDKAMLQTELLVIQQKTGALNVATMDNSPPVKQH